MIFYSENKIRIKYSVYIFDVICCMLEGLIQEKNFKVVQYFNINSGIVYCLYCISYTLMERSCSILRRQIIDIAAPDLNIYLDAGVFHSKIL